MTRAVLAQVEAREVEAEDLGLPHERPQPPLREPLAPVPAQPRLQQPQVGEQLRNVGVGPRSDTVVGAPGPRRRFEGGAEAPVDVEELLAVRLAAVALLAALRLVREHLGVAAQAREKLVVDAQPLGRAEVAVEPLDAAAQQPQREVVVRPQRFLGHLDGDVGIAVAVAADPAAEAQERGAHARPRVVLGHRPLEGGAHLRCEVVERLEVVEPVAHLVHHVRLVGARLLRLPERDELLAQVLEERALLLRREVAEVEDAERVADPRELREDRAPLGLRRVRGEHGHHEEAIEQRLHLVAREAGLAHFAHGRADRLPHRGAGLVRLARAAPQHAHALLLLGEVHELEVGRERLDDAARLGQGQRLDAAQQALARRLVAGAVRLREAAHLLDEVEERLALLLDDRAAEDVAEPVDLLAEPVARLGHGGARV